MGWVIKQKFGNAGGHLAKEEEEEEQHFGAVLLFLVFTNLHHPGQYQAQPCSPGATNIWAQPRPTSTSEDFLTSCGIGIKS